MARNLGLIVLAGGAAIIGLSFFMRKGEDEDKNIAVIVEAKITAEDKNKEVSPIVNNPGGLNVKPVRLSTVFANYAYGPYRG